MKLCRGALCAIVRPLAAAALTTALGIVPAISAAAQPAPGTVVRIVNFAFTPPTTTIAAGQTITFVNDDTEPHTVTAVDKSFDSAGLDQHDSWRHTFAKAGTYAYFCEIHPYMHGTVIVGSGAAKP